MLVLSHDVFYGHLQNIRALGGITLSHRVANSPPEKVREHTHTDAHFVLVTSGDYVSSAIGDSNHGLKLIYNPPGTTHRDHFRQGRGSFFTISISGAWLARSVDTAPQPTAVHLINRGCGLGLGLLMECVRWNSSSPLKAESLCLELLSETSHTSPLGHRFQPQWLRTACEMIQDCAGQTPSVGDISKSVGVHPVHLARTFRNFLGCTPGDLLQARRLALAASELMKSHHSLSQIALDSGFSDQSQFTKAFCRMYGIPAGAYRRLTGNRRSPRNVAF